MGPVGSVEPGEYGITVRTKNGIAEISLFRSNLVRIRIRKKDQLKEPVSYAVIEEPGQVQWKIEEHPGSYCMTTDKLILEIEKDPFRLVFKNTEGKIINEDDAFSTSWIGDQVATYKKLQEGERFIGLGEKSGPLDRRGNAYTNWNTDAFAYGPDDDPLYLTTPFFIGLNDGASYGIFMDNSYRSSFSFGASSRRFSWFGAEGGEMDYYFILGEVSEIIRDYSWLTGFMPLPPKWSLGYQQCRYSYYPDTEVRSLARTFREKKIPCDVIYLDIHYMDGYRVFTFHPEHFPDPQGLINDLKEDGFHTAVIMDPGIKVDKDYSTYQNCISGDHFVRLPDQSPYEGEVWPGWSVFPDFTDPDARQWWKKETEFYTSLGLEGLWNDMNEPTAWGHFLPNNLEFSWEGEGATHLQAHNVYGMQMARATREAIDDQVPKRPFVLTRAGYSGVQRYATVWTGDNVASDDHMLAGARLLTSMGLTGMPFTGYDVGAFVGECSPQLFARWMQLGTFSPFFRGHSMVNSRDSEPWSYGEQYEEICRNYIGLRYKMMPYIMSCMYEAHKTGMPLVRSLAIDHTWDAKIYDTAYQNQYLFGPSLMVIPVRSNQDMLKIYLPDGEWFDLFTDESLSGGVETIIETEIDKLPLFVKGGSALAFQSLVQHTGEIPADKTLSIHLYAGDSEPFKFELYEDLDQHHPEDDQMFCKRELEFRGRSREMRLSANQGNWEGQFETAMIWFHGYGELAEVRSGEVTLETKTQCSRLIEPISRFDPFGPEAGRILEAKDVSCIEISLKNQEETINLAW